jgi:ABC-type Zn uptake system ZnuABC Zn-binding protein ZnuA/ABC-type Mn2+/Zn2+ transport system permease subunit
VLETLDLPFVQRGLAEVALLSVGAGLIGTWIVLRGLAFYSHAVGTAAFPGLVLADGLGFAAALGAFGAAVLFALALATVPRSRSGERGTETALILVGLLALGVILASDVFGSSAAIESLLFGSLLLIDSGDLALAAAVSLTALVAAVPLGPRWIAVGFDQQGDGAAPQRGLDLTLLMLIGLATAAAVGAVGALLVAALFVVPAATTRQWCSRMGTWQIATVAVCAVAGTAGVVVSVELNTPPGATIAVIAGGLFACSAIATRLRRTGRDGGSGLRWMGAATAVLVAFVAGGCGADDGDGGAGPAIVATTPVVADISRGAAGSGAEVTSLLDPNTDPHDYEPRPDDIQALASADLVVASGGDLDAWIADAIADSGSNAELLVLSDAIPHPLEADGELDPHWWHDPRNAAAAALAIGERLGVDSTGYAERIESADAAVTRCLRAVPPADRAIVTDHDAFAYLAERYDVEIVGAVIPALTTEAQASAGELAELRATIEREGVRAVFPEASVSSDLARTIADETGASADQELYGDSLGPEGSSGETYLGMLAANADALVRGMTGARRGCAAAGA